MPHKGPHISIPLERLVPRVLGIKAPEFSAWPEGVREAATNLAAEMFLVRYNPFIDPELVRTSVMDSLAKARPTLGGHFERVDEGVRAYWRVFDADQSFRENVLPRLRAALPAETVVTDPSSLIACATDATDLRMELPMLMLTPETVEQVQTIVRLASETGLALIPRGGGTGATGGAIPAAPRTAILSLSKLKAIRDIDEENQTLTAEAGVITLTAIKAAEERGMLFTVDPASKAGSSIGGNISENSGGPFCFEYGVTLDNILSYRMVMPDGELVTVRRVNHPRHKIMPGETAVFEIVDESGVVKESVSLGCGDIRGTGLGKDVSNKYLGGLPGVQKEGVDGVIVEGTFTLHPRPSLSRTLCLEFFGRSMHPAMVVIKDIIALRDRIREQGDLVKISALEEFGSKYVQAINYAKKSSQYEGEPISVLLVQLDSDDQAALDAAAEEIMEIVGRQDGADVFAAQGEKEAEVFWEDRHKLSAIARRTSGFKINEDIVIPTDVIPEFSDFLEGLNIHYMGVAYRKALKKVTDLASVDPSDPFIEQEFGFVKDVLRGAVPREELSDQELEVQATYFFHDLRSRYAGEREALERILAEMLATRVVAANHMHAGDGNCHVNFPVNSNDQEMLALVHEAVDKVFDKVMALGGAVSGEHGIGITKIGHLEDEKIAALRAYKARVDPRGIINPGKLVSRALTVEPYTFSFNRLIQDLSTTALPDKERLITLLSNIQTCTRCGKCKQVCAMYHPRAGFMFHPRNKNISLGALIEAVYYSLLHTGKPDKRLLASLRRIVEHCTACGRCFGVCPVKIDSSHVALHMRAFLEEKQAGGHPLKSRVLHFLAEEPEKRVPLAAKAASLGQKLNNMGVGLIPLPWRKRFQSPMLRGPGPVPGSASLSEAVRLADAFIIAPQEIEDARDVPETALYFPGCGAGLFYREIGLAVIYLLLRQGVSVVLPDRHLCCGYPLLSQGLEEDYLNNYGNNVARLRMVLEKAARKGFKPTTVLTSCGTCRESLSRWGIEATFGPKARHLDAVQFLAGRLKGLVGAPEKIVYHAACHAEWTGQNASKAPEAYRKALASLTGSQVALSPGCCGESGLGALTSPAIYNKLRSRKEEQLDQDLARAGDEAPLIVGCPSCKIGIKRCLIEMGRTQAAGREREVLHAVELLARLAGGPAWKDEFLRALAASPGHDGLRLVPGLAQTI
ncbi:FAD linked oxidase domain-containing protein [Desulfovibrio sp. X2]|uniref:FAD-binding and (Fe-S)-binding domain-containing protein n=1 Tax=Desulfovibrio sp. X2 TaxID=941449 RepID=UPI0003587C8B|nr:FAD-binding and (Fe-S)-binding domain-containing protein [Desulfovibrio sp. X2]EPR38664.1 FAD linked oxidase domain-containing protein [Desulfovibrio sp. X2]